MIYVLYGQPASGKTTLGKLLADHLDTPFIIDGDEFREMFTNKNYGREGREENIRNANAVATYLNKKGKDGDWKAIFVEQLMNRLADKPEDIPTFSIANGWKSHPINKETHVVMSLVNPYERLRDELGANNEGQVVEVLLKSNRELRKEYHVGNFEEGSPSYIMNTDRHHLGDGGSWNELQEVLGLQGGASGAACGRGEWQGGPR